MYSMVKCQIAIAGLVKVRKKGKLAEVIGWISLYSELLILYLEGDVNLETTKT